MRTTVWLAGGLWVLLTAGTAAAQEPKVVKPGPEHAKLKKLVGTWDATVDMMGKESKGTMTYKLGLGGLWLLEHFKADFGGMEFEGMGATSYDPAKKAYVNIWIDSMAPTPMISKGNYNAEGHMVMKGKMRTEGKAMDVTMTSVMKDENLIVFTMTTAGEGGKDMTIMKITYKRKGG
jgi:hypothetical protein